jgi:hypothetical protein
MAKTDAANEAVQRYAAERTAADPRKLAKAVRAVRAALAAGRLTPDDLTPEHQTR